MQKRSRRWAALAVAVALGLSCVGCAGSVSGSSAQNASEQLTLTAVQALDEDNMFSKRDLRTDAHNEVVENITLADGASTTASGSVQIEGDTITITQAGTYRVSGTLSDGQIVVDTDKDSKVQLLLEGVSVTKTGSAALYLKQADKLFVTTVAGSENTFNSVGDFVQTDDNNVDGAIFAKDDLTLNGEGSLTVTSETGHGIVGKDDVKITSGTYTVTAAKKGIVGKDSLRIAGGDVTVTSGTNALQAENDDDEEKGYLYISGGTFDLTAGKHGLVSSGVLVVRGGTFAITCEQDAVHSNSELELSDGSLTIAAGDDGIHADAGLRITGGTIEITTCYEGIEGAQISIEGGNIRLTASDDGMNATGSDSSTSGMFGGMFGGGFGGSADASLVIAGGEIYINASGDGVDSNGTFLVSGGALYISGPTSSADAAIDYETSGTVTGGIVVATGAVGMAENFGSASTQGAILWQPNSTQEAGTVFTLTDASGNVLCSYAPEKAYQCVVVSAPGMEVGGSYTLAAGDTSETITLDSITYGSSGMGGQMGGMGGFGGGKGGFGGQNGFGDRNGQADSQPESGESTDGAEMPSLPDGVELPDGTEMPTLPDGVELPDGAQMPQMPQSTDGETPTLPDGAELPDGAQMPQMPDNAQQPQSTDGTGGTTPDNQMGGRQGKQDKQGGGKGGFGGQTGTGDTQSNDSAQSSAAASVEGTEA